MESRNQRLIPYPKRLHTLILSYQKEKNPKDLHKIIELIDRLLIKIIRWIYRSKDFKFLQYQDIEANEFYDTAIIALEKAISKIKVDEKFSIKKLSSYLNGYVAREFKIWFYKKGTYVDIETSSADDVEYYHRENLRPVNEIDISVPGFSQEAITILKKHIVYRMSLQEIADEMKVKKGYVRYWVDKGKKVLRKAIEKERKNNLWHL